MKKKKDQSCHDIVVLRRSHSYFLPTITKIGASIYQSD